MEICEDYQQQQEEQQSVTSFSSSSTTSLWWERIQQDEGYNSEEEGSRPIVQAWPEDSLLTKDHFTIDEQQCLKCKKKLGYALPMNKQANPRFLFCCDDTGGPLCALTADYLHCWACGNLNSERTGSLVSRPGNCAYYAQPSQIYEFMCYHCHKEMMENEPGKEECAERMKQIRKTRTEDRMRQSSQQTQLGGMRMFDMNSMGAASSCHSFASSLGEGREEAKKRKRVSDKLCEKEEDPDSVMEDLKL